MALSRPFFRIRILKPYHPQPFPLQSLRHLSFATPEEAAAERRRRKRRLRIEPPVNSLRHSQPRPKPQPGPKVQNPNAPKLPESVSVLQGPRLNLHNRILTLIRENDLTEASLLTRHSIYSNCRPTIFTCNAVLAALLRQSKYGDFAALHRFIIQAGVVPNIVTYNLLINAYLDCRKYDTALDHYKILINEAPFNPSTATYRILVRFLASTGDRERLDRAISLKDDMLSKGLAPDPVVYDHLISGLVKLEDVERALEMFAEVKEKIESSTGPTFIPEDIVRVYGSLMKAFFQKGMEKEAMDCLTEFLAKGGDETSRYKIDAVAYNSVLDALSKNGKFDEAMELFDRMMDGHNPPRRIAVNVGSFNVMVDMFSGRGQFKEAIEVFQKMEDKKCQPDTLSYNNLIKHLCGTGMVAEAEEIYGEMKSEKGAGPDEFTYVLLMDACFAQQRIDDAGDYFAKMLDSGLRPNAVVYNKLLDELWKGGKVDRAKGFFDQIVEKELKPDVTTYITTFKGLFENGKSDDVLKIIADMLKEDESLFTSELKDFVAEALKKEGREEDLAKVFEEREKQKEKEKEEALRKEQESSRARVSSIDIEALTASFSKKNAASNANLLSAEASSSSESPFSVQNTGPAETPVIEAETVEESVSESVNEADSAEEGSAGSATQEGSTTQMKDESPNTVAH